MMARQPLVSVITPFVNEERYLAECIESVLAQDYENFEYILVNNRSTDGSAQIAERFASADSRIRIFENSEFLPQIENFNRALKQISPDSVYTKIILADDWLYPDCLSRMVALAESHPSVGAVCSYVVLGWQDRASVYLHGLPVSATVMPGRDICRRFLLDGLYVFGSPSVSLIRSSLVRQRENFYAADSVVEDVDIFFDILRDCDFGFVHQVLSYTRRDNTSIISALNSFDLMSLTRMLAVHKYGPTYLEPAELRRAKADAARQYYDALGLAVFKRMPDAYWEFHRRGLRGAGMKIELARLAGGIGRVFADLALNPKSSIESMLRRLR